VIARRGAPAAALLAGIVAGAAPAAAHPPVGIVPDAGGSVFYSDLERVWRIAPDGACTVAVEGVHTHELALDAEGNLCGEHLWYEGATTDRWGHRVWRRRPGGAVETVIPPTAGFLSNYSFVRDAAGTMYWAEGTDARRRTTIRRRLPDGSVALHAPGPFRRLDWMTAAPDGTLYVVDRGDLLRIEPDGRARPLVRGALFRRAAGQFHVADRHAVYGLWLGHEGDVYVALLAARAVVRVDRTGAVTLAARSRWPWSPAGGLLAPDGALWLLESGLRSVRVRRVAPDGGETVFGP
jgi:streptogramin lyase